MVSRVGRAPRLRILITERFFFPFTFFSLAPVNASAHARLMNLSPVGKRDTLKACLQAAQLAAEKERERCEAREATADFAALPPSAQELQKVEWELQDLLADGDLFFHFFVIILELLVILEIVIGFPGIFIGATAFRPFR